MAEINPKDYVLVRDKDSLLYSAKHRTLQNNNWETQIRKLDERKGFMTEISDLLELRNLLNSRRRVFDGKGDLISTSEKQSLLDENFGVRDPWRAEYLGNRVFEYNERLYMESGFRAIDNQIRPTRVKEIHPKVMKNGYTSYKYFDEDGLAIKLTGNEVYFYYPRKNCVVGFWAGFGGADLGCFRYPDDSYSLLGVRASFQRS